LAPVTNQFVSGREFAAAPRSREESPTVETTWDILERFGQALQACADGAHQVRLVLASLRDSLAADAVFFFPGTTGEELRTAGAPVIDEAWVRAFVERVVGEMPTPNGQLLRPFLDPGSKPMSPWPASVALVRLSRTRQVWLGALSFSLRRLFRPVDLKVMMLARRMLLNHRQQMQTQERLRDSMLGLVRCLTTAIDAKDPYTWGHSERVARMAVCLGRHMAVPESFVSDLYLAGLLHDVGKIGIRDAVLQKPGKLTPDEMAHIQEHPVIGDRLVATVKALQHVRPGVRNHHERWDGAGYPDRLVGEGIPLLARVLAVADSCDAMMSPRPYRSAMETPRIDTIIAEGAGSQWDPRIVEHFIACHRDMYSICQVGLGDSVNFAIERALSVSPVEA
jgi:HD-GYP domain-containing protein (c-di-GMP phosphodiesterase class II)